MARAQGRAAEPRAVGEAFCGRSGYHGPESDSERRTVHGSRRAARFVRFLVGLRPRQPHRPLLPVSAEPGNESLGQYDGDCRAAEAGGVAEQRAGGADHPGGPDHEGPSGEERFRRTAHSSRRARERADPAGADRARMRGVRGDADRVRQPLEPAAGAHGGSPQGDCHPHGAGSRAAAPGPPDADGRADSFGLRSGAGGAADGGGDPRGGAHGRLQHPASRERPDGHDGARIHPRDGGVDGADLRAGAGGPDTDGRAARCTEGHEPRVDRRQAAKLDPRARWWFRRSRSPACCWWAPAC